jgi:hypothetical protein
MQLAMAHTALAAAFVLNYARIGNDAIKTWVHICSSTAPKFNVPHFNQTPLKVAKTYINVTK